MIEAEKYLARYLPGFHEGRVVDFRDMAGQPMPVGHNRRDTEQPELYHNMHLTEFLRIMAMLPNASIAGFVDSISVMAHKSRSSSGLLKSHEDEESTAEPGQTEPGRRLEGRLDIGRQAGHSDRLVAPERAGAALMNKPVLMDVALAQDSAGFSPRFSHMHAPLIIGVSNNIQYLRTTIADKAREYGIETLFYDENVSDGVLSCDVNKNEKDRRVILFGLNVRDGFRSIASAAAYRETTDIIASPLFGFSLPFKWEHKDDLLAQIQAAYSEDLPVPAQGQDIKQSGCVNWTSCADGLERVYTMMMLYEAAKVAITLGPNAQVYRTGACFHEIRKHSLFCISTVRPNLRSGN